MIPILIVLTLAFPFLYKYSFVITNQFSQIPIILSFLNPNYLTNDWYVSINKSFGPRTIFAWYMAQTVKIFPLPLSFFLHYILYIFLVTIATYKLTYSVFKQKFTAMATTICVLFGTSFTLGGNILVTRDFVAPQLPLGLSLLAISFLLEKKYLASSILFSLATYLHPLLGFEPALLSFFVNFVVSKTSQKSVKKMITKGIIPFLLISLPAISLYLKEGVRSQISSVVKIAILAFMRNPHHFVPSFFPPWHYIQFFILLTLFAITLFLLKKKIDKFILKFLLVFPLSIIFLCVIGFIGTKIIPLYPVVVLQVFRLTLFVYWICSSLIFGGIFYMVSKKTKFPFMLFIPIFLTNPSYFSSFGKIKILATLIGLSLILFYRKLPKYLFIFLLVVFFSLFKFHEKFNFSSYTNYKTEEAEVALWAKENTDPQAIFLVPPEFESFRLIANRAIVADWKAFPFQETAMCEWANRICDIGNVKPCNYKEVTYSKIMDGYRTLTEDEILDLAKKYDFKYMITNVHYPSFKKIYENKPNNKYYIYKITDKSDTF